MTAPAPADIARRREFLAELPVRLSSARGPVEFVRAVAVDTPGTRVELRSGTMRLGGRLLASVVREAAITLDPPEDARWLADAWGIEHCVVVSGDVGQRAWHLAAVTGDLDGSGTGRALAVTTPEAGRWELVARLAARPTGPLPAAVGGASPAYELRAVGGAVVEVEVRCSARHVEVRTAADPDARALLAGMERRWPIWRTGWHLRPDDPFVVVYHAGEPAVGGALRRDEHGRLTAVRLCVADGVETSDAGSVLLDALESLALDDGENVLRLDGSVFLGGDGFPYERYGYVVGPPYAGDTDVDVWAERALT